MYSCTSTQLCAGKNILERFLLTHKFASSEPLLSLEFFDFFRGCPCLFYQIEPRSQEDEIRSYFQIRPNVFNMKSLI